MQHEQHPTSDASHGMAHLPRYKAAAPTLESVAQYPAVWSVHCASAVWWPPRWPQTWVRWWCSQRMFCRRPGTREYHQHWSPPHSPGLPAETEAAVTVRITMSTLWTVLAGSEHWQHARLVNKQICWQWVRTSLSPQQKQKPVHHKLFCRWLHPPSRMKEQNVLHYAPTKGWTRWLKCNAKLQAFTGSVDRLFSLHIHEWGNQGEWKNTMSCIMSIQLQNLVV